jgi:hypothetical protein
MQYPTEDGILCLGGPWDGQYADDDAEMWPCQFDNHVFEYVRETLWVGGEESGQPIQFFRFSGIPITLAFKLLFLRYPNGKESRDPKSFTVHHSPPKKGQNEDVVPISASPPAKTQGA